MNNPIVYWGKDVYSGWDKKPFSELKAGNVVMDNEFNTIVVAEDAHLSGDGCYDGYLFYDDKGDSWFPESFANRKITGLFSLLRKLHQGIECRPEGYWNHCFHDLA